jgi:hypothetical protein
MPLLLHYKEILQRKFVAMLACALRQGGAVPNFLPMQLFSSA